MTESRNYQNWTREQHLAKAVELAAEADGKAEHTIGSQAAQQRLDVEQTVARARLHIELAREKNPEPAPVAVPEPELQPALAAEPEPAPRSVQRKNNRS